MKKLTFVLAGMVLFLFTSCLSSKVENFNYKERALTGTPENSVIFIGCLENNSLISYSQSNSEYAPDYQTLEGPFVISAPVAPGSRYRLAYVAGSYTVGRTVYYWSENYSMQVNNFDIKIPDEPGIYYFGYYSGNNTFQNGTYTAPSEGLIKFSTPSDEKREYDCLQMAYDRYRGTAWESVIKERMKELKK